MNHGSAFSIKNTCNTASEYCLKMILIMLPTFLRTYDAYVGSALGLETAFV